LLLALVATDAQAWGKKKKVAPPPVEPAPVVVAPPPPPPPSIYFGDPALAPQVGSPELLPMMASPEVQATARWIAASHDNAGMYFLLLDKVNAQVYFFHPRGYLVATAPALLGMGKGDKMLVPNTAPMSAIPPQKRITPAGRYVSRLAIDSHGKELLVIDYDASLSLHPVVKGTPVEHRAQRLASPTAEDNRISFGCINVPPAFYANVVSPALTNTRGVVYILPETSPAGQVFGFQYDGTTAPATAAVPALPAGTASAPAASTGAPAVPAVEQVSTALGAEGVQAAPIPGAR
jgi:hypothetical protein